MAVLSRAEDEGVVIYGVDGAVPFVLEGVLLPMAQIQGCLYSCPLVGALNLDFLVFVIAVGLELGLGAVQLDEDAFIRLSLYCFFRFIGYQLSFFWSSHRRLCRWPYKSLHPCLSSSRSISYLVEPRLMYVRMSRHNERAVGSRGLLL